MVIQRYLILACFRPTFLWNVKNYMVYGDNPPPRKLG